MMSASTSTSILTLTTCLEYPELPNSLNLLRDGLNEWLGADNWKIQTWQSEPTNGLILPLCAWDYSQNPQAFLQWIKKIEQFGGQLVNSPNLIRWNMNKSYLIELSEKGILTIPTYCVENEPNAILNTLNALNSNSAVIKPIIGQSGWGVEKIQTSDFPFSQWLNQFSNFSNLSNVSEQVIIQPFMSKIMEVGEVCLIFFSGKFSHAVLRKTAPNEWRANSAYQVQIQAIQPNQTIIEQAQKILSILPEMPIYARVDGLILQDEYDDKQPKLMLNELELIEPALYWQYAPQSITNFIQELKEKAMS